MQYSKEMKTALYPYTMRMNKEDAQMIEYLKTRLGMGTAPVFRLALRRLYQAERAAEKRESN